jgi:leader peptidase (prepilin peptidase)/N-methyltransferase
MTASWLVIGFGLVIGSFLNVVIHRLPLGKSVVRPGSACPSCGKGLGWRENIPLLGFLLLRGKCSGCGARISWRYPLVEFLTALLFWLSFRDLPPGTFAVISQLRIWLFLAIGVAVVFIDLDHRIIPDELSLGGWLVGALTSYWDFRNGMPSLLLASLAGFGFFYLTALAYEKATGRSGLGGGDIKFMGTIGVFLGFGGLWSSIMISSFVGVLVGLALARFRREDNMLQLAIPYGPFLVSGAFVELFFEVSRWISP